MDKISVARIAGLATMTLAMAGSALAQTGEIPGRGMSYYHGPGMMWGGDQWGGFGMVLGPIFMILVLVGIVLGVVYIMRHFGGLGVATNSSQAEGRALAILKERYAKGEIDSKEFDERKAKLVD
ncbi:Short C-terminal domain [Hoeflea sp. IMCC20628]|uniref:SHOCT domain-containing protein n=1 Tax=Hoeflea sp. IMCC20628 TaxID=1620421 RepID=UPI00063AD4BF|nr:SHOCT domain-containing protein [Hoeflea sp. IMCC20628]AKI01112.1 Short C-terminal domain [Hoeflea sp. IMCC20628]